MPESMKAEKGQAVKATLRAHILGLKHYTAPRITSTVYSPGTCPLGMCTDGGYLSPESSLPGTSPEQRSMFWYRPIPAIVSCYKSPAIFSVWVAHPQGCVPVHGFFWGLGSHFFLSPQFQSFSKKSKLKGSTLDFQMPNHSRHQAFSHLSWLLQIAAGQFAALPIHGRK